MEPNTNGIFADGSGGAGPSNVSVKDSVLGGSTNVGIAVASSGVAFNAVVENTLINFNINVGAAVAGASATLRIAGYRRRDFRNWPDSAEACTATFRRQSEVKRPCLDRP